MKVSREDEFRQVLVIAEFFDCVMINKRCENKSLVLFNKCCVRFSCGTQTVSAGKI